jgi:Carbohydrate esterase, sialic acid-specific acetylesterase
MKNSLKNLIASLSIGVCLAVPAQGAATAGTVKVFILAGQSNMEGHATVECLEYQATKGKNKDEFAFCRNANGWVERDDVFIDYLGRRGKLTVGYGAPGRQPNIGPELGFGFTVGDKYDQPVLLIKTAWGGKSLGRDFLPPSVGLPSAETLKAELQKTRKRKPNLTMDELKAGYGAYYRLMISEVKTSLAETDRRFPELVGRRPEICGLVWFQGWNDMINRAYTAAYTHNLVAFIRDVRRDLNVPKLPVVIGQMGVGGMDNVKAKNQAFRNAEAAVLKVKAFKGNVALVKTGLYWDKDAAALDKEWNPPGKNAPREEVRKYMEQWRANCLAAGRSNAGYHYLGSPKTLCEIGKAFGEAMIALQGAAAQ